ncbi:MAG: hypothetical protein R3C53_18465 [Pirellulaceae bacterium]
MFEIQTGCRLHFGLMELAEGQAQRFGGLGLMLDRPGWRLRFSIPSGSTPAGLHGKSLQYSTTAEELYQRFARVLGASSGISVELVQSLPLHSGLGAGTQFAAALAAGAQLIGNIKRDDVRWEPLNGWSPIDAVLNVDATELASLAKRGLRSAVGLQGFLKGGLILDEGYDPDSAATRSRQVKTRCARFPEPWRTVLVIPHASASSGNRDDLIRVSGEQEAQLLNRIARQPNPHRETMFHIADEIVGRLTAAPQASLGTDLLDQFSTVMSLLEQYLRLAGELFREEQGGIFNGSELTAAAAAAEKAGLRGVGQSSWGPTIFGFAPDAATAERIACYLSELPAQYQVLVANQASSGALWRAEIGSQ